MMRILYHGLIYGLLLAIPAALCIPLSGLPHMMPPVYRGAEYVCIGVLSCIWALYFFVGKKFRTHLKGTSYSYAEFILIFAVAIGSALIMMRALFVLLIVILAIAYNLR